MKYLFTKNDCEKCQWIKDNIDLANVDVQNLDENPAALGLLAYYECVVPAEKGLPILVVGDDPFTAEKFFDFDAIVKELSYDGYLAGSGCSGDNCKL